MGRILVLKPYAVSRLNGGEIALMERLALFRAWGHEVSVVVALDETTREAHEEFLKSVGTPLEDNSYDLMETRISVIWGKGLQPDSSESLRRYEEIFQPLIFKTKPHLVLTHYTDFPATATALQWDPERVWVDQTDDEYPRLQQMKSYGRIGEIYSGLRHITVASPFLERSVKRSYPGVVTHLCLNPLLELDDLDEPKFEFRAQAPWLHINPTAVKGIDFVLELAAALADEKFLLVGNWGSRFPDRLPSNVKTIERQASLTQLLRSSKGLLMPSVWQEAFGRVPLEAMANALPVIASDRGALPETVGQGGIVLPLDLELWKGAMRQTESFWKHQVIAGWKRFKAYQSEVKLAYAALRDELSMLK